MGIQNLFPFLKKQAPSAFEAMLDDSLQSKSLKNRRLGIDVAILLHRAKSSNTTPFCYLNYIAERIHWIRYQLEAQVLIVCDGSHPGEKSTVQQKRRKVRESNAAAHSEAARRLEQATDDHNLAQNLERVERLARAAHTVTAEDRQLSTELFQIMGCLVVDAPGEAEMELAMLQRRGIIDDIITEDGDALIAGAHSIIRNFWMWGSQFPRGGATCRVHTAKVLSSLGINAEELGMLAAMAGCDFAPNLPGVGIHLAYKAVRDHGCDARACLRSLRVKDDPSHEEVARSLERASEILRLGNGAPKTTSLLTINDIYWRAVDDTRVTEFVVNMEKRGEPGLLRQTLIATNVSYRDYDIFGIVGEQYMDVEIRSADCSAGFFVEKLNETVPDNTLVT